MKRIFIELSETPLNLVVHQQIRERYPDCGGVVTFSGIIRNQNQGRKVTHLEYYAYRTLALKQMQNIAEMAVEQFDLAHLTILHRQGNLAIGDTAVWIQTLSHHRKEAFAGCQYAIDTLKKQVPIWKKEWYQNGSYSWPICQESHG